jgi:hypothetical protein
MSDLSDRAYIAGFKFFNTTKDPKEALNKSQEIKFSKSFFHGWEDAHDLRPETYQNILRNLP